MDTKKLYEISNKRLYGIGPPGRERSHLAAPIYYITSTLDTYLYLQMTRLPGLPSSNIMLDTLTGRDDLLDFDDIFNSKFVVINI